MPSTRDVTQNRAIRRSYLEFNKSAAHHEANVVYRSLLAGITLKDGSEWSVYFVCVFDGLTRRGLLGHVAASAVFSVPSLRVHIHQVAGAVNEIWDLNGITADDGWVADGALAAPPGSNPVAGKAENPDNRREVAAWSGGLFQRSLLQSIPIDRVWPDFLHIMMRSFGHFLAKICHFYVAELPQGLQVLVDLLASETALLRIKLLPVGSGYVPSARGGSWSRFLLPGVFEEVLSGMKGIEDVHEVFIIQALTLRDALNVMFSYTNTAADWLKLDSLLTGFGDMSTAAFGPSCLKPSTAELVLTAHLYVHSLEAERVACGWETCCPLRDHLCDGSEVGAINSTAAMTPLKLHTLPPST